ncbi:MAG: WD40 repeat domain-containing protein, partial [Planctomycetales bacterium]|nr:WD40 repeat domain-containing protein [Planctomycetales bacterium]
AMAPFNDQNADRGDRSEETTGLRIWDWTNGSVLFDGPAPVESAMYPAVSPDERFVTFGVKASHVRYTVMVDGSNVRLETPTEYGQKYRVNGPLVFSQDGKLAATSVYSRRCMASVIDATTGEFVCEIDSVTARRTNRPLQSGCKLGFSPDGTQIVVADHTGRVAIWSVQDGALLKEIDQYKKTADLSAPGLAVSKHGGIIVGGSSTERRLSINHF